MEKEDANLYFLFYKMEASPVKSVQLFLNSKLLTKYNNYNTNNTTSEFVIIIFGQQCTAHWDIYYT